MSDMELVKPKVQRAENPSVIQKDDFSGIKQTVLMGKSHESGPVFDQ